MLTKYALLDGNNLPHSSTAEVVNNIVKCTDNGECSMIRPQIIECTGDNSHSEL